MILPHYSFTSFNHKPSVEKVLAHCFRLIKMHYISKEKLYISINRVPEDITTN